MQHWAGALKMVRIVERPIEALHRDLKSLALLVLRAGKIAVLESERHIFEFLISEDGADEGPQCQRCVSFNRDTLG